LDAEGAFDMMQDVSELVERFAPMVFGPTG
jgi:hypothetical protein